MTNSVVKTYNSIRLADVFHGKSFQSYLRLFSSLLLTLVRTMWLVVTVFKGLMERTWILTCEEPRRIWPGWTLENYILFQFCHSSILILILLYCLLSFHLTFLWFSFLIYKVIKWDNAIISIQEMFSFFHFLHHFKIFLVEMTNFDIPY